MRVYYKMFQSAFASREKVFDKAAEFASPLGPDRLITISYSEDRGDAVVTVWYWAEQEIRDAKEVQRTARQVSRQPASPFAGRSPVDNPDRELARTVPCPQPPLLDAPRSAAGPDAVPLLHPTPIKSISLEPSAASPGTGTSPAERDDGW